MKSHQEVSIVELQLEIAKRRDYADFGVGTGVENSKVGDSYSNWKFKGGNSGCWQHGKNP